MSAPPLPPELAGIELAYFGRRSYLETLAAMRRRVAARAAGAVPDALWLVEHEGVYTAGRRRARGDVLAAGLEPIPVERGGRITWHGPGQLVAYPIVRLEGPARDLHAWLALLEEAVLELLAGFGLEGRRGAEAGVFVGGRKIASIGVAVRRWTTFHGLALNVAPDLAAFRPIRPCGLPPEAMTSLAVELGGEAPSLEHCALVLARILCPKIAAFTAGRRPGG